MLQPLAKLSKSVCPSCGFLWCCHCKAKVSSLSLPPAHMNQPFSAPLGCEGHTGPSQSFHHPRSWLPVFLYAECVHSLAPTFPHAPGLRPSQNKSLIVGASSHTMDPAETILLCCSHPATHTGHPQPNKVGQSLLPACLHQPARHGGVPSITGCQKHLLSLLCCSCSCLYITFYTQCNRKDTPPRTPPLHCTEA